MIFQLECKPDQFECDSGVCIDKERRCDGKNDCNIKASVEDFSDEDFCDCKFLINCCKLLNTPIYIKYIFNCIL